MNTFTLPLRWLAATACLTSFLLASAEAAKPYPSQRYGMNLNRSAYYAPIYYFNNALLQTGKWLNSTPSDLPVDENGWPTDLQGSNGVGIPLFLSNGGIYPTGNWVLEWEGEGELALYSHGGGPSPTLVSSEPNRRVYSVPDTSANGFRVIWQSTAAAPNHVKNARLWMPGQEDATGTLHPDIVADHEGVKVIRTMDLSLTNGSSEEEWSDRTLPNAPVQDPLAWEHHVAIANQLGSDLWICLPHAVNDNYVEQLAALIHDQLDPELRVWVEYSNEVWNYGYPFSIQSNYVLNTFPGANLDESYTYRATQLFDIFADEFGGVDRVVRVLASHSMSSTRSRNRLAAADGNVDVLAITSYFGNGSDVRNWIKDNWPVTIEEFAEYLLVEDILGIRAPEWDAQGEIAKDFGVTLANYEGNQHVIGGEDGLSSAQNEFIRQFHVSQESADLYRYTLDYMTSLGLLTHMAFTNYETPGVRYFGHREYPRQPLEEAHTWRVLLEWLQDNRPKPEILSVSVESGELAIEWRAEPGASVIVESSTNLTGWETVSSATASGNTETASAPFSDSENLFLRVRKTEDE